LFSVFALSPVLVTGTRGCSVSGARSRNGRPAVSDCRHYSGAGNGCRLPALFVVHYRTTVLALQP